MGNLPSYWDDEPLGVAVQKTGAGDKPQDFVVDDPVATADADYGVASYWDDEPVGVASRQGFLGDAVDTLQHGAIQGAGGALDFVGADDAAQVMYDWAGEQRDTMSPDWRASLDGELFSEEGDYYLGEDAGDLQAWVSKGLDTLGMMAVPIPGGAVTAGVARTALGLSRAAKVLAKAENIPLSQARLAVSKNKKVRDWAATTIGYGGAEGAVAAGLTEKEVRERILSMDQSVLDESPLFQEVKAGLGGDSDAARAKVADQLSKEAGWQVFGPTAFLGAGAGRFYDNLLRGAGKGSRTGNIGKGAVTEAAQEAPQSAVETVAGNRAMQQVDASVGLYDDLVPSMLEGASLGGFTGGAIAGMMPVGRHERVEQAGEVDDGVAPVGGGVVDGEPATGAQAMGVEPVDVGSVIDTAPPLGSEAVPAKRVGMGGKTVEDGEPVSALNDQPDLAANWDAETGGDDVAPLDGVSIERFGVRGVLVKGDQQMIRDRLLTQGVKVRGKVSKKEGGLIFDKPYEDVVQQALGGVEILPDPTVEMPLVSESPPSAIEPVAEKAPPSSGAFSFQATHKSVDGEPLMATDEAGLYVDRDGAEVEDAWAETLSKDELVNLSSQDDSGAPERVVMRNGKPFTSWTAANKELNKHKGYSVKKDGSGFVLVKGVDAKAHEAATSPQNDRMEPTRAQKEAGNYKKGHVQVQGLDIAIENPKGSERSGVDAGGRPWSQKMKHHYGYIKRSEGADGDQVDVFLGSNADRPGLPVFVVDQVDPETGRFDEHKVMIGFSGARLARRAYLANYEKGWKGIGNITKMSMEAFKGWLKEGDTAKPVAELRPVVSKKEVSKDKEDGIKIQDEVVQAKNGKPFKTHLLAKLALRDNPGYEIKEVDGGFVLKTKVEDGGVEKQGKAEKAPAEEKGAKKTGGVKRSEYGASNKVFTEGAADKARELLKRKLGTLNAGIDPEVMQAGITLAGYHIEAGARSFSAYSKAMVDDLGEAVRPYLRSFYEAVRSWPGFDTDGMTSYNEIEPEGGVKNVRRDDKAGAERDEPEAVSATETGRRSGALAGKPGKRGAGSDDGERSKGGKGERKEVGAGAGAGGKRSKKGGRGGGPEQRVRVDKGQLKDQAEPSLGLQLPAQNYRITSDDAIGHGGAKTKARQNLAAIRILKALDSEGRGATPDEQAALVKYVGWGASELANGMFPVKGKVKSGWEDLSSQLREMLTAEEWEQASRTTQYAHYTSPEVISGIYDGLARMGLDGGVVMEPGMGVGHFAGLMPSGMASRSHYTGIEFDAVTAGIAKHLYPESNIQHADFTRYDVPPDYFDLVIGNPPFSSAVILSDPRYKKQRFSLHEYFFAKSIDSVRPGGLQVFVTSRYLMDRKGERARQYLMDRSDLLGAVRLPQTAFKANAGTEVVTDILFLQKRAEGAPAGGASWSGLSEVEALGGKATINEYFADHPEMVLGEHALTGSMYGKDEYTVNATSDIGKALAGAVEQLPVDVYSSGESVEARVEAQAAVDFDVYERKNKAYYLEDGKLMQMQAGGVGRPVKIKVGGRGYGLYKKQAMLIRDLVPLKEAAIRLLDAQAQGDAFDVQQAELNRIYDAFVSKHGPVNKVAFRSRKNKSGEQTEYEVLPNFPKALMQDPDAALLMTIDSHDPLTGEVRRKSILTERILEPEKQPKIETASDALAAVLNRSGRVDVAAIAEQISMSESDVLDSLGDLVYRNPVSGEWETQDEYLSGRVRDKLRDARVAAKEDVAFTRNVEALERVQPADIPPSQITARLGASWITAEDVEVFAREVLGLDAGIDYSSAGRFWALNSSEVVDHELAAKFGTQRLGVKELLDAGLNQQQVNVYDSVREDGKDKQVLNSEQTELARAKLMDIKTGFERWIWQDGERAERLARHYNDMFNDLVPRRFDGSHLTLPGVTVKFELRPHQKRVVWRIIQSGNTYMAHTVGSGKTMASIAAGMEQKRLGMIRKPMYVVPNHMLKQFATEFLELYPAAKILVADEENFHARRRAEFVARSATENWDGVVITHSAFGLIGAPREFEQKMLDDELQRYKAALEGVDDDQRATRKRMEKLIENMEQRLSAVQGRKQDDGVSFEQMGVDMLFVDEAHEFRKLSFATSQGNVKGIDPSGSAKAWDLYVKSQYLDAIRPGRSLVLMSGTPVTNTMGEMFTLQRFLQRRELERKGLDDFDSWSGQFADTRAVTEQTPSGGYKVVTRLARFVNIPELLRMFRDVADVVRSADLDGYVVRPVVRGGAMELVTAEPTGAMRSYQGELARRMKAIEERKGPAKKGDDIILSVITDGRHAALDDRYIDPELPSNPETKLNLMIDRVYKILDETKNNVYHDRETGEPESVLGATQMIFADLGVSDTRGFSAYDAIKQELVAKGVPADDIAYIRDYKKASQKLKLFADLNSGRKRILIGSSRAMGTGVNAQQRLYALHHLDAPWYPADMEQRRGRMVRQGNKNKEVLEFGYAAKGTYDSTMFTMLETKQRFIDQMWADDFAVREMDDLAGDADQYALAKALSSGDERLIQKVGLEQDVARLQRLRNAHADEQVGARSRIARAESDSKTAKQLIAKAELELPRRVDTMGDDFSAVIDGRTYTDRKKAGSALIKMAVKLDDAADPNGSSLVVGRLAGFDVMLHIDRRGFNEQGRPGRRYAAPEVNLDVTGVGSIKVVDVKGGGSPLGLMQRLENQARKIEDRIAQWNDVVAKSEMRVRQAKAVMGKPFDREVEFHEAVEALARLDRELLADSETEGTGAAGLALYSKTGINPTGLKKSELESALLKGRFGKAVREMLGAGKLRLHQSVNGLPRAAKQSGTAGIYYGDQVHLVADNIEKSTIDGVLLHEIFHSRAEELLGKRQYRRLMSRLERIETLSKGGGKVATWFAKARAAVPAATPQGDIANEIAAYAIEQYSTDQASLPRTVRRWVKDFIARIRVGLMKMGWMPKNITPADLAAIASSAVSVFAKSGVQRGTPSGEQVLAYSKTIGYEGESIGEAEEWIRAYKKFGKEGMTKEARIKRAKKMGFDVDKVMYHGSNANISRFDPNYLGKHTAANSAKQGFFFAADPFTSQSYIFGDSAIWATHLGDEAREVKRRIAKEKGIAEWQVTDYEAIQQMSIGKFNKRIEEIKKELRNINPVSLFPSNKKLSNDELRREAELKKELQAIEAGVDFVTRSATAKDSVVDDDVATGNWFPIDPAKGSEPNIMPMYLAIKNPLVYDFQRGEREISYAELLEQARNEGKDGAIFKNTTDGAGVTDIYVAFDPSQIRSVFAAFDPAYKDSGNILSSIKSDQLIVYDAGEISLGDVDDAVHSYNESLLERGKQWFKDAHATSYGGLLGALTFRQLAQVAAGKLPHLKGMVNAMQKMQTARNIMADASSKLAVRWQKLPNNIAQALADLMHVATIAEVDPSLPYQPIVDVVAARKRIREIERIKRGSPGQGGERYQGWNQEQRELRGKIKKETARKKAYPEIRRQWDLLPDDAKEIFIDARDAYTEMSERMEAAVIARIEAADLDKNVKISAKMQVRMDFEQARLEAPYFPLQRFGKFYVMAKRESGFNKKTGEVFFEHAFFMFDSVRQRRRGLAEIRNDGWSIVRQGQKSEMAEDLDSVSESFVADTVQRLREQLGRSLGDAASDVLYQSFLGTMPFLSSRVKFIHRKKTPGYSGDALRAFSFNMAHQASQVARMEAQPDFSRLMGDMDAFIKESAKELPDGDVTKLEALQEEAQKRHEWLMNPQGSPWAAFATTAGFMWYLGLSPAAALVNLSQTAIIAFPELSSKFGVGRSFKALNKAMIEVLAARRKWKSRGDYSQWHGLSEDERKAFKIWHDTGEIDVTEVHMLLGLAESESTNYDPKVARAIALTGTMFQEAEVVNREATLLAGYRLARDKGMSHAEAVDVSAEMTWNSHYDYSNANRARWMQSNAAKVLLLFRSYSQHTTFYLWRNFYQSMKGESAEVKVEARKRLLGVLGMTGLFAGSMGMPLMGVIFAVSNAAASMFGDDDEPWDAETEWRNMLADWGVVGQVVDRGAVNALTGADVSSRVSLNDLWFRGPDRDMEGKALYGYWLAQAMGPVGGMVSNMFRAVDLADDGKIGRAFEAATPKAIKDGLKTLRYADEGVLNFRGDPVVPREAMTPLDLALQAIGFAPDKVSAQWDANNQAKLYEHRLDNRRQSLVAAYALAYMDGDGVTMRKVMRKIRKWNRVNRRMAISIDTLTRSVRMRRRYSLEADAGLHLRSRTRYLRDETRVPG